MSAENRIGILEQCSDTYGKRLCYSELLHVQPTKRSLADGRQRTGAKRLRHPIPRRQ